MHRNRLFVHALPNRISRIAGAVQLLHLHNGTAGLRDDAFFINRTVWAKLWYKVQQS